MRETNKGIEAAVKRIVGSQKIVQLVSDTVTKVLGENFSEVNIKKELGL